MLTLDNDFKGRIIFPSELDTLFELNPNRKEYIGSISKDFPEARYVAVENALMNPYDVRDFLINSAYIAGTNNLVPDKTGAPGMQQPIANEWMKPYVQYLRDMLFKKKITSRNIQWQDFCCYCNVFWRDMKAIDSNYRPHVDPGDFAFNLFLSDDMHEDDGTAIFSINVEGQKWLDVREMEKKSGLRPSTISQVMDINRVGAGVPDDWVWFTGDEVYNLEGVVPGGFNCISGYRGSMFHTANYNPAWYPEGHVRYSLVSMLALSLPPAGKSAFISEKPKQ